MERGAFLRRSGAVASAGAVQPHQRPALHGNGEAHPHPRAALPGPRHRGGARRGAGVSETPRYAPEYRLLIDGADAPRALRASVASVRDVSALEGADRVELTVTNDG